VALFVLALCNVAVVAAAKVLNATQLLHACNHMHDKHQTLETFCTCSILRAVRFCSSRLSSSCDTCSVHRRGAFLTSCVTHTPCLCSPTGASQLSLYRDMHPSVVTSGFDVSVMCIYELSAV
jgi:hypothetical protein